MKREVKVSFYLKRNEKKKDGKCPVMARLNVGTTETVFSAKITISEDMWSGGRASGKSSTAVEINRQLDEIRASAISHYRDLSSVRMKVTAEDVKCVVLGMASGQETLLSYFRTHNENFDKRVGINRSKSTAKSYWNALSHVEAFLKEKYNLSDIPFTALNRSFIDKFDLYLRIDVKNSLGTIVLYTTRLNTIVNNAIADGIITVYPFAGYEAERPEKEDKYLTEDELEKIMTTPMTTPRLLLVRDLFLFSCFTGIPHCDLSKLTEEELGLTDEGKLKISSSREKTNVDYEVPLLDVPLHILERYRDITQDERLLPVCDLGDINKHLKIIADMCGIDKRLTFHCGRHTFGSEITLSQGVPIETVSRMLGHRKIKTTQIYAKITNHKILEDMAAIGTKLSESFQYAI